MLATTEPFMGESNSHLAGFFICSDADRLTFIPTKTGQFWKYYIDTGRIENLLLIELGKTPRCTLSENGFVL